MRALWNGAVIAEAAAQVTHEVEGNTYFPYAAVPQDFLRPSDTHVRLERRGQLLPCRSHMAW